MIKKYQKKLSHREMQNYNLKKAQVSGEFIISILNGLHDFKNETLKLLEKYGIKDPKKEEWHSFKLINFNNENREAEMMSDTPYPCDFERGIIMYVANKFNPKNNKNLLVVHKDLKTCRKRGIDYCIYLIKW